MADNTVDAVARAILGAGWDDLPEAFRDSYRDQARRAMGAMPDAETLRAEAREVGWSRIASAATQSALKAVRERDAARTEAATLRAAVEDLGNVHDGEADHFERGVMYAVKTLRATFADMARAVVEAAPPMLTVTREQAERAFQVAQAESDIDGYGDEGRGYDPLVFARCYFANLALSVIVVGAEADRG